MSEQAASNRDHAGRIAYLERQMAKAGRIGVVGYLSLWVGFALAFVLLVNLNLTFLLVVPAAMMVLGVLACSYCGNRGEQLEEEFAEIAMPEDWLNKTW